MMARLVLLEHSAFSFIRSSLDLGKIFPFFFLIPGSEDLFQVQPAVEIFMQSNNGASQEEEEGENREGGDAKGERGCRRLHRRDGKERKKNRKVFHVEEESIHVEYIDFKCGRDGRRRRRRRNLFSPLFRYDNVKKVFMHS